MFFLISNIYFRINQKINPKWKFVYLFSYELIMVITLVLTQFANGTCLCKIESASVHPFVFFFGI
jgi:hypothetical protein